MLIFNKKIKNKKKIVTGFEPATAGFEVQRAIHCATRSGMLQVTQKKYSADDEIRTRDPLLTRQMQ